MATKPPRAQGRTSRRRRPEQDDSRLAERFRQGEAGAFAEVMAVHQDWLAHRLLI